jgi:threonyl-tRNA synthetase
VSRIALWDSYVATLPPRDAAASSIAPVSVDVQFNGVSLGVRDARPGVSSALDLVSDNKSAAPGALVAVVDGATHDLSRPLPRSLRTGSTVNLVDFSSPVGRDTLWHSAAHVLGQAIEFHHRDAVVHLSDGPALEDGGFFYDAYIHDKSSAEPRTVSVSELPALGKVCKQIVGFNQPFERLDVPVSFARQVFAGNPFKQQILDRIAAQPTASACASEPVADAAVASGEQTVVSLYRCGPLIDLCRGPHVPSTGVIPKAAIAPTKVSASVLHAPLAIPAGANVAASLASASAAAVTAAAATAAAPAAEPAAGALSSPAHETRTVQRVYGMAFPTDAGFAEWTAQMKAAEKADHRRLGRELNLFMFHNVSPGSAFFLPHGTRVYNALVDFMRRHYRRRGFSEVRTPQVFDKSLWQQSGHWDKYQDDMFFVSKGHSSDLAPSAAAGSSAGQEPLTAAELQCTGAPTAAPGADHGLLSAGTAEPGSCGHSRAHGGGLDVNTSDQALKPMNCPGHCVMFGAGAHSYRDLPLRLADFGGLHRNEVSGALSGLTRVRAFTQDDAHIFCTPEQLRAELFDCVQFIRDVYGAFGFPFHFRLSTRPEKYIGDVETWDAAEKTLSECLDGAVGAGQWGLNPGDGAFYGPKVDVTVRDALGRLHQCATIQLDFNLPRRFGLKYHDADGAEKTPVMIHRAILGSVERFMAVVLEHTLGKLPLWLSPRQVAVVSVAPAFSDYAASVAATLRDRGFYADAADSSLTLSKQVRTMQLLQYNYICIVGEAEASTGAVSVRLRGSTGEEPRPEPLEGFIARLDDEKERGQGFK